MAAYQLEYFIESLESIGVADVLLPFILVFTIVFAILQKAQILGDKKNFNIVIALATALSVVIPHVLGTYPSGYDVVNIINEVLPQISLLTIALLMMMILVGLTGFKLSRTTSGFFAILALIGVIAIFGGSLGVWESDWIYNTFGEEAISVVVMILVFGLIIFFITKGGGGLGTKVKDFLDGIVTTIGDTVGE